MPQIEIRPAALSDLSKLTAMDHSFKTNYVWQMDVASEEGQMGITFREVRLPRPIKVDYPRATESLAADWPERATILVGLLENQPVGYISISEKIAPTTAWVTNLVVDPAVRRQGIGSALALASQDLALQRRLRRTVLEMQSKNIPAIHLARKLGYDFCGYNDHYYENQDIAVFFGLFLR
ncbi:MAG TPA: GNAT family N-acetyltransferase [Anaerolineaceae bacterium]